MNPYRTVTENPANPKRPYYFWIGLRIIFLSLVRGFLPFIRKILRNAISGLYSFIRLLVYVFKIYIRISAVPYILACVFPLIALLISLVRKIGGSEEEYGACGFALKFEFLFFVAFLQAIIVIFFGIFTIGWLLVA